MMFENKQKCLQNKTTHRYRNIIKFKCVKMTIYLLVAEKFLFLLQSPWQKKIEIKTFIIFIKLY